MRALLGVNAVSHTGFGDFRIHDSNTEDLTPKTCNGSCLQAVLKYESSHKVEMPALASSFDSLDLAVVGTFHNQT